MMDWVSSIVCLALYCAAAVFVLGCVLYQLGEVSKGGR